MVKDRPFIVDRKIPSATAVEENTPMTVSLARADRRRTRLNSRAKTTAKITAARVGRSKPQMAPMAMPVKAEWPRASEKKDIRLWTTIVDRIPNRGVMTSTASRACFIKYICPGWAQSKGRTDRREYQSSIIALPLSPSADGRCHRIPERTAPRPADPPAAFSYSAK